MIILIKYLLIYKIPIKRHTNTAIQVQVWRLLIVICSMQRTVHCSVAVVNWKGITRYAKPGSGELQIKKIAEKCFTVTSHQNKRAEMS